MKTIVELHIQHCQDRENVVTALANAGYFVTVEERKKDRHLISCGDFYVIVKEDRP
jgi:hypothetical protein